MLMRLRIANNLKLINKTGVLLAASDSRGREVALIR